MNVPSEFWFWRKINRQRQTDVERNANVPKWKLSLLDSGHCVLTLEEKKRLATVTGIAPDQLAAPCEPEPREARPMAKRGAK